MCRLFGIFMLMLVSKINFKINLCLQFFAFFIIIVQTMQVGTGQVKPMVEEGAEPRFISLRYPISTSSKYPAWGSGESDESGAREFLRYQQYAGHSKIERCAEGAFADKNPCIVSRNWRGIVVRMLDSSEETYVSILYLLPWLYSPDLFHFSLSLATSLRFAHS